MKNNNDPIRQENKKALPKFILIVVVCMRAGAALGFAMARMALENLGDALAAAGCSLPTMRPHGC